MIITKTCANCSSSWSGRNDLPTVCPECGFDTDLPVGYREAFDKWARAVDALEGGETTERVRELWAKVNHTLDTDAQR